MTTLSKFWWTTTNYERVNTASQKQQNTTYLVESIADLLLGSSVGVGRSALHGGDGISTSLNDALETIDDIVEAGASTARARSEKRDAIHGVESLGNSGKTLGLLSDLLDGLDHGIRGNLTLFDWTGGGSGGKEGHDGSDERGEVHIG